MIRIAVDKNVAVITPFPRDIKDACTGRRNVPEVTSSGWRTGNYVSRRIIMYAEIEGGGVVPAGLIPKVIRMLTRSGQPFKLEDTTPPPDPPDLSKMDTDFRFGQKAIVDVISSRWRAIIKAPPALGKTWLIRQLCLGYSDKNVLVITKKRSLLGQIHADMTKMGVDVCRCDGSHPFKGRPVCLCSQASLHKIPGDWPDIIFYDECHNAAVESVFEPMMKFINARMYGFSATPKSRTDGSNLLVEALFGKVEINITYNEAVKAGVVAPIGVWMVPVEGPDMDSYDDIHRCRSTAMC